MIKNLVANGCSFTGLDKRYTSWSEVVADKLNVSTYKNLGMGGAGNRYIALSTIDYLEHANLNPSDTAVVIMWSGPSRKDIAVSKDWWDYVHANNYTFGAQFVLGPSPDEEYTYWVFSGGIASSWNNNSVARELFSSAYKSADAQVMCKESLTYFNLLSDYLTKHKYRFKFTSFINYWKSDELASHGEFNIGHYCQQVPSYQQFDFTNWLFVDSDKNSFGEFAQELQQIDSTYHPTGSAHQQYAENFVIPALKEFL